MPLIIHLVQVLLVICEKLVKCKNITISDIELEGNVLPPDKGKEKAVPDDTALEGSKHDLPTCPRTMYHLQR